MSTKCVKALYGLHQAPQAWSMIGSLMYVTASRPDIMFAVCACSRFQVTPKTSHLSAVKRIFRYLKGKPKLGLWYPRESYFDWKSYSASDFVEQSRLGIHNGGLSISWQETHYLGNAKSKPLWPLLLQKPNMLLLQAAVGKFYGFKIKC
ncbi:hypothetical protein Tco_0857362 [Tanacetum coccineum]|uniref:Reverse transcriptase Ty1/copia-type domain-containing protein n=1 Tax=Tanacetum coccineum TaxID=301880 RepID=A0ABQ5B612_9ASTR